MAPRTPISPPHRLSHYCSLAKQPGDARRICEDLPQGMVLPLPQPEPVCPQGRGWTGPGPGLLAHRLVVGFVETLPSCCYGGSHVCSFSQLSKRFPYIGPVSCHDGHELKY